LVRVRARLIGRSPSQADNEWRFVRAREAAPGSEKQVFYPDTSSLAIAADGKRFAVFPMPETVGPDKGSVHVIFMLNFFDELQQRAPVGSK
jgi:hypothetical protein